MKIGLWRSFFYHFDGRLGFIGVRHDMSNLGTVVPMVVLLCFCLSSFQNSRFWFMCGYYLLIKHLHSNMTRFSTWDRGSIDQISPLSIAPYVYEFWMNVLGTGTPSHLLYICDKNYPIPSYIIVTAYMKHIYGFRPSVCTYMLNWAMRTSWGWCDEWGDTALQTPDSKFERWCSDAEHALGHRGSPQY